MVDVHGDDRSRLEEIVADRNSPQKYVWRFRIVLLTSQGVGTAEIMRLTGKSKTAVWRWQERAGMRRPVAARQDPPVAQRN
jgi:hypothetical protein